jgi:hypothetical protein
VSDKAREAAERAAQASADRYGRGIVIPWDLALARTLLDASGLPEQVEQLEVELREALAMRNQDAARRRECALNHIDKAQARRAYTEEMAKRKDAEAQLQEAREALSIIEAHARYCDNCQNDWIADTARSALGVLYEKGDGG